MRCAPRWSRELRSWWDTPARTSANLFAGRSQGAIRRCAGFRLRDPPRGDRAPWLGIRVANERAIHFSRVT